MLSSAVNFSLKRDSQKGKRAFGPFTDMGRSLAEDGKGVFHQAIVTQLKSAIDACAKNLDNGVVPEKYRWLKRQMDALKSAHRIVDVVWHLHHRNAIKHDSTRKLS